MSKLGVIATCFPFLLLGADNRKLDSFTAWEPLDAEGFRSCYMCSWGDGQVIALGTVWCVMSSGH